MIYGFKHAVLIADHKSVTGAEKLPTRWPSRAAFPGTRAGRGRTTPPGPLNPAEPPAPPHIHTNIGRYTQIYLFLLPLYHLSLITTSRLCWVTMFSLTPTPGFNPSFGLKGNKRVQQLGQDRWRGRGGPGQGVPGRVHPSVPRPRGTPHRSAQLRAAPRQQLGTERLLRAPWAGAKWEEVRGGRGGGEDGEGLSETKEFLKIRGEMRRGTKEEPARLGALLLCVGVRMALVSTHYFCKANSEQSALQRPSPAEPPRLSPSLLSYKEANKQANTGSFSCEIRGESACRARARKQND